MDAFAIEEPSGGGRGCDEGVRTDKIMCRVRNYISYATTHAPSKQQATKEKKKTRQEKEFHPQESGTLLYNRNPYTEKNMSDKNDFDDNK